MKKIFFPLFACIIFSANAQLQRDPVQPVEGSIVYSSTVNKPDYYDGSAWKNNDGTTTKTLVVGDSYQGGKVAYILQATDPGYDANTQHGIIAAPADQGSTVWGCFGTTISGAQGTAVGTGKQNTIDIIKSCATAGIAARLCIDLVLNGYSDWYLPSKDELNKLYINRAVIGGFTNFNYWSSTELNSNGAWGRNFGLGHLYGPNKNSKANVRAIRGF